jgi:uncharacterized membrane-anchored protein YitT (DUF2179 family)
MTQKMNIVSPILRSLIIMTIGCFIFAIGFNVYIFPLRILTGGVTGISIIINEAFGVTPAYTQWALNIPLFFFGWFVIGNEYAVKIIYGSFFLPLAIRLTEGISSHIEPLSQLPSTLIGAGILGLGLGLILDAHGSTGGLDIPARIVSMELKIGLGLAIGLIDSFVIVLGMISFQLINGTGLIQGLNALLVVIIMTLVIDLVTIKQPGHNILRNILQRMGWIKR